jgi:thymidylate synthase (FAD)
MKIIQPSIEYMGPVPTDYAGALRHIERCGRLCYKSEDKITDTSAEPFVHRLIKAGHLAMVEHSSFVARTKVMSLSGARLTAAKYLHATVRPEYTYIGGNLTAWYQRCLKVGCKGPFIPFAEVYGSLFGVSSKMSINHYGWEVCPHDEIPKELHRYSVRFVCDRGVSHELVRHRPCSFAQESTRYVNYGGKEMEFIEPDGFSNWHPKDKLRLRHHCENSELCYNQMLESGCKPQQARAVLPNALKTEIIVTADAAEWRHIRKLRTAKDCHPDMQRVMNMVPWEEIV